MRKKIQKKKATKKRKPPGPEPERLIIPPDQLQNTIDRLLNKKPAKDYPDESDGATEQAARPRC